MTAWKEGIFCGSNLSRILALLAKDLPQTFWPRLVGGCVRDALLGLTPSDIDISTPLEPQEVEQRLQGEAKVIPTGISFGTVTAVIGSESFEITTLRRDIECYGRRAKVQFTADFKEDAERRDFTINAMSYCTFSGEVFDYFGGIDHLKNRQVVFIGKPEDRIKEDYLRIMRFFRFSASYAAALDQAGCNACCSLAENLNRVSSERVKTELDKLLLTKDPILSLGGMLECHIFELILPGLLLDVQMLDRIMGLSESFALKCSLELKYAALLHKNNANSLEDVLREKKFSRAFIRHLVVLTRFFRTSVSPEQELGLALYDRVWNISECVLALSCAMDWNREIIRNYLEHFLSLRVPSFPVNGQDLVEMGWKGKEIGEKLSALKLIWAKSSFAYDKQELLGFANRTPEER